MRNHKFAVCVGRSALSAFVIGFLTLADVAIAGQDTAAGIIGRVSDESGAVLPGVTVTATSPALQVPAVVSITNERGEYRLSPLPVGLFTVVYELSGFGSFKQEGVRLTVGFTARVDVLLKVGALTETVTVSGVSPVVDAKSTAVSTQFTKETLELIPTSRNGMIGLMAQAPGVRTNFDVGGSTLVDLPGSRVFGQPGEAWAVLEGVTTTSLTSGGGAGNYWDYAALEEAQVNTLGADAEMPTRGIAINAVLKSGGNDFHGGAEWGQTNENLQSNNIDDGLAAQGITSGNALKTRFDHSGNLGGRIIRNKLWFFGAVRYRGFVEEPLGVGLKPDGSPITNDNTFLQESGKVSLQATAGQRFSGFFQHNRKHDITVASRFIAWESRTDSLHTGNTGKIEWQGLRGNSLVFSLLWGQWGSTSKNPPLTPGGALVGRTDLVTLFVSGEKSNGGQTPFNRRRQTKGSVTSYRPDFFYGNHEFKVGFDYTANVFSRAQDTPVNNYNLIFQNGVPFQIRAFNFPTKPWVATNYIGIYAKDSWTVGRRFTLNLGLRYAHDDGFVPEACRDAAKAPGHLAFPAVCFAKVQFPIWSTVAPRVHASYALTDDGRTLLKGGWARFDHMRQLDPEVLRTDLNAINMATYRWRDLNGNGDYNPGEVNLDPNGPDFVSRAVNVNAIPNPNEKEPKNDELSLSLERELARNFSARVTGLYSRMTNAYRLQNNLRPYESYNVPVTRPDPGPDGRVGTGDDPGTSVTFYEFPVALSGLRFEQYMMINDSTANTDYKSFEVAASKRLQNRWMFMASHSATKKNVPVHNGLTPGGFVPNVEAGPYNPNAEINQADRTWEWQTKMSGAYIFPAEVMVSANFERRSGNPYARQVLFTGGQTIPSIVLNVEPIGTRQLPTTGVLDLRLEKSFSLLRGHKASVRANLFNVLNVNTVTALTMRAGAAFLQPTAIVPARILQVSASSTF